MVNPESKGVRYDGEREYHCDVRSGVHVRPLRREKRKIGHVKIPEVHVGISPDWKTNPPLYQICKGPA